MKTTMYESGISCAFEEVNIGAESLWMVPMLRTGDAAARSGSSDHESSHFMMAR